MGEASTGIGVGTGVCADEAAVVRGYVAEEGGETVESIEGRGNAGHAVTV